MTISKIKQPFIALWTCITGRYIITRRWMHTVVFTQKTWIKLISMLDAVKMSIIWATELICVGSSVALMVLSVRAIYSADLWYGVVCAFVALWMILVLLLINHYASPAQTGGVSKRSART